MNNEKLRKASGEKNYSGKLVGFLYELMRDYLTPGVVERLVREAQSVEGFQFTNGFLADYAKYLEDNLLDYTRVKEYIKVIEELDLDIRSRHPEMPPGNEAYYCPYLKKLMDMKTEDERLLKNDIDLP